MWAPHTINCAFYFLIDVVSLIVDYYRIYEVVCNNNVHMHEIHAFPMSNARY